MVLGPFSQDLGLVSQLSLERAACKQLGLRYYHRKPMIKLDLLSSVTTTQLTNRE